jgi:hypothetical protein
MSLLMELPQGIMNKPVMAVLVLTIIAVGLLTLYSFGPLAQHRTHTRLNPASLEPSVGGAASASADTARAAYHSQDVRENYYTVSFPRTWQIQAGATPGSYAASFGEGTCTIELMDVPDNTTLELYVLSQEEPRLKKATTAYRRVEYRKLEVGGSEAYQLTYSIKVDQIERETSRTYIAGPDMAAVVTFAASPGGSVADQPAFSTILTSFRWENR